MKEPVVVLARDVGVPRLAGRSSPRGRVRRAVAGCGALGSSASLVAPAQLLELVLQPLELAFLGILDVGELVARGRGADELVELEMDRPRIAILGRLHEEDHEKR